MAKKIFFIQLFLLYLQMGETAELRDVKPPINFPSHDFLLLFLFVVVIIGVLLIVYFLKKNKKQKKDSIIKTPSPWQVAFEQLEQLHRKNLLEDGQFKIYFSVLSDIVRNYIEDHFKMRAQEMTTEEFLISLKNSFVLSLHQKASLKEFLNSSDLVKFARYQPSLDEAYKSFELAKKFVEETIPKENRNLATDFK